MFTIPATCPLAKPEKSIRNHPNLFYCPFNDIPATPSLLSGLFRSRLRTEILYAFLFSSKHAVCPAYLILLDLNTRIIFGEKYKSECSSKCNFLPSSVASSALDPNIFLSTLLSNTVGLYPSLNMRYQVSHPHRKTGEIIAMCF